MKVLMATGLHVYPTKNNNNEPWLETSFGFNWLIWFHIIFCNTLL